MNTHEVITTTPIAENAATTGSRDGFVFIASGPSQEGSTSFSRQGSGRCHRYCRASCPGEVAYGPLGIRSGVDMHHGGPPRREGGAAIRQKINVDAPVSYRRADKVRQRARAQKGASASEFAVPHGLQLNPIVLAVVAIRDKHAALNGAPGGKVGDIETSKAARGSSSATTTARSTGARGWRVVGPRRHLRQVSRAGRSGAARVCTDRLDRDRRRSRPLQPLRERVDLLAPVHRRVRGTRLDPRLLAAVRFGSEAYGYPITDETSTGSVRGRFNHFRRFGADGTGYDGSIYWSPATGAHPVYGGIRGRWLELGEEGSYLGLPVSDELAWTDPDTNKTGRTSHFERGAIAWTSDDDKTVEFPARRVMRSGHIGVSSVGGWVELVLTSAGTFHFRGHLQNSGFVGLYCTVAAAVRIPGTDKAVAAQREANVGGTTSIDDRDEDWDDSGTTQRSAPTGKPSPRRPRSAPPSTPP
ncbi:LGFP repeat-containing protein [Catellatospora sichuanensis]|uniref:LGFP repeat-containing protein n=1 Tax=Catellatospora sichuanensis TaxID=1969805 RepID=UPI00118397D7|nr:hypothetical protein [Catellatospora sichuanensis]